MKLVKIVWLAVIYISFCCHEMKAEKIIPVKAQDITAMRKDFKPLKLFIDKERFIIDPGIANSMHILEFNLDKKDLNCADVEKMHLSMQNIIASLKRCANQKAKYIFYDSNGVKAILPLETIITFFKLYASKLEALLVHLQTL